MGDRVPLSKQTAEALGVKGRSLPIAEARQLVDSAGEDPADKPEAPKPEAAKKTRKAKEVPAPEEAPAPPADPAEDPLG